MSRLFVSFLVLPILLPGTAAAQEVGFELTPYFGYQFGGSFETDDRDFGRLEFDVDESSVFGVTFDIPITRRLQFELLYFRHGSQLDLDEGLFDPTIPFGDVDLEFVHGGVIWQSIAGQVRPYFGGTAGVTLFDAELGGSETEVSLSLAGGVKLFLSEHLGLRLDGRFFITDLGDERRSYYGGCCYTDDNADLVQGQVTGGLIFAF